MSAHKQKLVNFYRNVAPQKLNMVDALLETYRGKEADLFLRLEEKYSKKNRNRVRNGKRIPGFDDPEDGVFPSVLAGLKTMYRKVLKPLEQNYLFHNFFHPVLRDSDIDAAPMLMLTGQYSTGKTSFIKYLLQRDFPGIRIGPEPTTDRFVAIMQGEDERIIPGNALVMQADKPFTGLSKFGSGFLTRLECAQMQSQLLSKLTIIDTPGVLAGEKQSMGRSYNFEDVMEWFANRSDRILILFDAHKLDISDEFKKVLLALRGNDDKIRVVLNKADAVTTSQLMRVYGSMMWSLGKVVNTPEVMRVYIGSFWNEPIRNKSLATLFEHEMADLVEDIKSIPRNGVLRKINELVKRARKAKVHALIIGHLRANIPLFGRKACQRKLTEGLADQFYEVKKKHDLVLGDFPDVERFQEKLSTFDDWGKFKKLDPKLLDRIDEAMSVQIPTLMKQLPALHRKIDAEEAAASAGTVNPFGDVEDYSGNGGGVQWAITGSQKSHYDNVFADLTGAKTGKVSGQAVMGTMRSAAQGLPTTHLRKIWNLADNDKDGKLTAEEFAVAMYLINECNKTGAPPPTELSADLVPPSQRK